MRNSFTIAASEQAKIPALAAPPAASLTLNGYTSEEGGSAGNLAIINARITKVKTALQVAAVLALIAVNPAPAWVDVLVYTAVAATLISGVDYFFGLRSMLAEQGTSSHSRSVT